MSFCLQILGSGSAVPSQGRNHTSHALTVNNNIFLIDCGEGTQLQLKRFGIKKERIRSIFISHLHGDHYLGLMGLLSTMHLFGRTKPLTLVSPPGLREILMLQLKYSLTVINYDINYKEIDGNESQEVFKNRHLKVTAFPLEHRIPCFGYRFDEKPKQLRINKKKLPKDIKLQEIALLKAGKDILDDEGTIRYSNKSLTLPPHKSRSYAFCSDTRYALSVITHIKDVDLLYHESTFIEKNASIADKTYHSTAEQAARIAKASNANGLIIGHYSARYKDLNPFLIEAKKTFKNTQLAEEGKSYCIEE